MPYSHLPYPTISGLAGVAVVPSGQSRTIWVSPSGNDATGDGTESFPYFSLKTAWETAQQYTILGNGILYVTFKAGNYDYSETHVPDNLYHPQGSNIIIQGDPTAFRQRYLYRVQEYNWDITCASYCGHTGTVQLTSVDSAGHTHGFVSGEANGWVAISDPTLSSAGSTAWSYYDPTTGVGYGGNTLDNSFNAGDGYANMFMNHGFSYEHALGIMGLAQVKSVPSTTSLELAFKNINHDPRSIWYAPYERGRMGGGGSYTGYDLRWYGLADNYPTNQYSFPVGFYGLNGAWTNYPTKTTEAHITDHPMIVSNYPVAIRYSGKKAPFVVDGCRIRAIRNFMICSSEYASIDVAANKTKALNALYPNDYEFGVSIGWFRAGIHVDRGEVGIRHIGVFHADTAVFAKDSTVSTYTDFSASGHYQTVSGIHTAGENFVTAKMGSLENSPVLQAAGVRVGVHSDNSKITLGNVPTQSVESGAGGAFSSVNEGIENFLCEGGTNVQFHHSALYATNGSSITLASVVGNNVGVGIPRFKMEVLVPVWQANQTATGNTWGFFHPTTWGGSESRPTGATGFQNLYKSAALSIQNKTRTIGSTIGYITQLSGGGTLPTGTVFSNPASAQQPVHYQLLNVCGYRAGSLNIPSSVTDIHAANMAVELDFRGISVGAGRWDTNLIKLEAYSDNSETIVSGGTFGFSDYNISASTSYGYWEFTSSTGNKLTGVSSGTTTQMRSYSQIRDVDVRRFDGSPYAAVHVHNNSRLLLNKNIIMNSTGFCGLQVENASYAASVGASRSPKTALLFNGCGPYGIRSLKKSDVRLQSVMCKNWRIASDNFSLFLPASNSGATADTSVHNTQNAAVTDNLFVVAGEGSKLTFDNFGVLLCVFAPLGIAAFSRRYTVGTGQTPFIGCTISTRPYFTLFANSGSEIKKTGYAGVLTTCLDGSFYTDEHIVSSTAVDRRRAFNRFIWIGRDSTISGFVPYLSQALLSPDNTIDHTAKVIHLSQYCHVWATGNEQSRKICTKGNSWKYGVSETSPYYQWWKNSGTRPSTTAGRTAGYFTPTGNESVVKVRAAYVSPLDATYTVLTGVRATSTLSNAYTPGGSYLRFSLDYNPLYQTTVGTTYGASSEGSAGGVISDLAASSSTGILISPWTGEARFAAPFSGVLANEQNYLMTSPLYARFIPCVIAVDDFRQAMLSRFDTE